jgi:septum formation protein
MSLILASASPRRSELLRNAGIDFFVDAAGIGEDLIAGERPQECAQRLAAEKARVVFKRHPDKFVLGADTIVVVDGAILGKPPDKEDASRMLHLLSGHAHDVITGICLMGPPLRNNSQPTSGFEDVRYEITRVFMTEIAEEEIIDYVETGEPMDKAGAYAIQGRASRWITRIEGDYFNVVGLPISLVYRMLRQNGAI